MNTFYVTPDLKLTRVEPTTGTGRITFQSLTSTLGSCW